MNLKLLLQTALLCLVESAAAQGPPSSAVDEYRQQFQKYVESLEGYANETLRDALTKLSPKERQKVPPKLKVRVGWAGNSADANRVTGCGMLGQPASVDPTTSTVWLCEEGTRTVANLMQALILIGSAASLKAFESEHGRLEQPSQAMQVAYNQLLISWGPPATQYLVRLYAEQVSSRILGRQGRSSCRGYVVAYLAIHQQSNGGVIDCSSYHPDVGMERRAENWLWALFDKQKRVLSQALAISESDDVSTTTKDRLSELNTTSFDYVIDYFVLHELGHLVVDDARIPAKATNDERVTAEVAADKFALDSRLGNLELKPMVMFALVAFWDYLVIYASGHRFNGPMASARGKSLYSLMCDGSHDQYSAPDPRLNQSLKRIQQLNCAN